MKILYVVSRPLQVNTSASIRNRATIDGLIELGHDVNLITTEFDKNHASYDSTLANQKLNTTYLKLRGLQSAAKIGRKYKFLQPLKSLIYRLLSQLEVYDNLKGIVSHVPTLQVDDNTYDLVITSSDPKSSHLFVLEMLKQNKIKNTPWIQIWGDPFATDISRKNKFMMSHIQKEEKKLLHYATKVIYVSKPTLLEQKKLYTKYANKMFYVPIPYVEEKMYPVKPVDRNTKISLIYCGDYTSSIRNIQPLYDAVNEAGVQLTICGGSDINLKSTQNITIYPRVSFEKTKEFEKEADVLVHVSNLRGTQIPGKVYQYSGTNKTILFVLDGDKEILKETFEPYNRYVFCENTKESIIHAIMDIKSGKYQQLNNPVKAFSAVSITKSILQMEG